MGGIYKVKNIYGYILMPFGWAWAVVLWLFKGVRAVVLWPITAIVAYLALWACRTYLMGCAPMPWTEYRISEMMKHLSGEWSTVSIAMFLSRDVLCKLAGEAKELRRFVKKLKMDKDMTAFFIAIDNKSHSVFARGVRGEVEFLNELGYYAYLSPSYKSNEGHINLERFWLWGSVVERLAVAGRDYKVNVDYGMVIY